MSMQSNVGKMDAGVRYILGFVLLAVLILVEGPWRWVGLLGIILIATAVINWCPIYNLIGVNTKKSEQGPDSKAL